jgi:hypothetical protein
MKKALILLLTIFIYTSSPAEPYWQQKVDTKLQVKLDDQKHFLYGYEEIDYTNNSPDTLKYIYMHLWPNAYEHDHTAFAEQETQNGSTDFYYSASKDKGYIDSLSFLVDGQKADYHYTEMMPDVSRIDLPKPLPPGAHMHISTPFEVKIPKIFSRLGHTKQAYFISQWFPKPAVYDRKGWHPIPYLDQGEFYSEIGSYDVSITLPGNYIVMATGNCSDKSEMQWLDSLSQLPLPNDTTYLKSWPASDARLKTLHYHEDNVHDFAWFADKRWIVRKDTTTVPETGNIVTAYAAFLPVDKKKWLKGTDYLKATVQYYGKWVGPYPYKTIKAVEGDMHAGGGMEYPTVTIIDRTASSALQTVVVHEAGHNWFYGMLATNERDHAWMDEGINTFYEHKTTEALGKEKITTKAKGIKINVGDDAEDLLYYEYASIRQDQALDQTSANFTKLNYGGDVYYKTALVLKWLEQYMGEDNFEAGMHEYFNTWKHKHPYPEDLQTIMQKHSDKSLDWFFKDILNSDRRIDYALRGIHHVNGVTEVRVKNKSGINAPVRVDAYQKDSLVASGWSMPFTNETTVEVPTAQYTKLKISDDIPDVKRANNSNHGGLKLGLIAGLNRSEKERLFIAPALGYNNYDGFQLGLLFHNITIPENRFRFAVAPMYGFKAGQFTGTGSMSYTWYSRGLFSNITLQVDGKSFDYNSTGQNIANPLYARYVKIAPALIFTFNEHNLRSPAVSTLTLKGYGISEDVFNFNLDPADSLYKPSATNQQKVYGLLRFDHKNQRTFNPYNYSIEGQMGADFAKINIEGRIRIDYMLKNKALYVRGYFGKFFDVNNNPTAASRYYLNSTFTGANDYLYDDTYIGRSDQNGFAAHQVSIREGGFKVPTPLYTDPIGRNDNWLASVNLSSDIPKIPLIRLFLDAGTYANAAQQNPSTNKFIFDGGLELHLLFDAVKVYLPLLMSKDLRDYMKSMYPDKQVQNSIVFSIELRNWDWLKAPSKVLKRLGN